MAIIELDRSISSLLLTKMMDMRRCRRYKCIDETIENDDYDIMRLLLISDIPIESEIYVATNIGDRKHLVQHLLDRGVRAYDHIAIGAASVGDIDTIIWMTGLGARGFMRIASCANMFKQHHVVRWMRRVGYIN